MKTAILMFLVSPVFMSIFKLVPWEPFASLGWFWVFSPWLYVVLVFFTTTLVYTIVTEIRKGSAKRELKQQEQQDRSNLH